MFKYASKLSNFPQVILIIFLFFLCLLQFNCAGNSPLIIGIVENDINQVKLAVESGEDINRNQPLIQALVKGRWEIAKYLIDAGADVNIRNNGISPLMLASAQGSIELTNLLIEKGADVNAIDNAGYSVLMHACSPMSTSKCLDLLIENGADIKCIKSINEGLKGYKRPGVDANLYMISAMEYRHDFIEYFKNKNLKSLTDKPVVCSGYGESGRFHFIGKSYDSRFEKSPNYTGKLKQYVHIIEMDGEKIKEISNDKWNGNSTIGTVTPGTHDFKVLYLFSYIGYNAQKTTVRSEPMIITIDCQPNTINVLFPIVEQNLVNIKVFDFKL